MKVYFPGLNGLRFIAALVVIVSHLEEMKDVLKVRRSAWPSLQFMTLIGDLAVTFFFVLSGFLITFLLLLEKQKTHSISVEKFYFRRILRILPLYYLIFFLGFFLLPHIGVLYVPGFSEKLHHQFWYKAILFLLLIPNVAYVFIHPIPYISHTWSIGVEEQFYLVWPHVIKFFKNPLPAMLALIALYLLVQKGLHFIINVKGLQGTVISKINDIIEITRIHCMAIGAVFAYVYYRKKRAFLQLIYRKSFQIGLYIATIIALLGSSWLYLFVHEVFACLFGLIILNISTNSHSILNFENFVLNYLGKISYGIYMYHFFCIRLTLNLILGDNNTFFNHDWIGTSILLFSISSIITIIISSISYHFFEHLFLKLKANYTVISSNKSS